MLSSNSHLQSFLHQCCNHDGGSPARAYNGFLNPDRLGTDRNPQGGGEHRESAPTKQASWGKVHMGAVASLYKTRLTHLTTCLCRSTQYLMAERTSTSCFFVSPFGPTEPLLILASAPVLRRKFEKSC